MAISGQQIQNSADLVIGFWANLIGPHLCAAFRVMHSPSGGQVGQADFKIAFHAGFEFNLLCCCPNSIHHDFVAPATRTGSRPPKQGESASASSGCRVVKLVGEREALTTLILGSSSPGTFHACALQATHQHHRAVRRPWHAEVSCSYISVLGSAGHGYSSKGRAGPGDKQFGGSRHRHGGQARQAVLTQHARPRGTTSFDTGRE